MSVQNFPTLVEIDQLKSFSVSTKGKFLWGKRETLDFKHFRPWNIIWGNEWIDKIAGNHYQLHSECQHLRKSICHQIFPFQSICYCFTQLKKKVEQVAGSLEHWAGSTILSVRNAFQLGVARTLTDTSLLWCNWPIYNKLLPRKVNDAGINLKLTQKRLGEELDARALVEHHVSKLKSANNENWKWILHINKWQKGQAVEALADPFWKFIFSLNRA